MTTLAANIDATQTLILVDAGLTNGSFQLPLYYTVDSEAVRVIGRAHRTTWLVERGIAGTTAATHSSAATLTRYYPDGATGDGAGGVPDPSGAPDGQTIVTLDEEYGLGTSLRATDALTGAFSSVALQAQEDVGSAEVGIEASAQLDGDGNVLVLAVATEGAALVQNKATSAGGSATARLDATSGSGDSESRLAVLTDEDPPTVLAGVVARHVDGVGDSLNIIDGDGQGDLLPPDPGSVLTYDATLGSKWLAPADPLTSDGAIVISADGGANVVTVSDDGSFEVNGSGVVRIIGLPSADPEVAGQLWNNVGVLMVSEG